MAGPDEVDPEILDRLRATALALPDAVEEQAWVGTRWRVGRRTPFAHVVTIDTGWPPAYAKAAGTDGPATVLTVRAEGEDLDALAAAGPPFFKPVWFPDIVGLVLGPDVDWDEVAELVTESYRVTGPRR